MKTQVTFRHLKSQHPKLQEEAVQILEGFSKFSEEITSANVEFLNETNKTVVISVHLNGNTLIAKEASDDFGKSLRDASDKIVRQIQKLKTKNLSTRTKNIED